MKEQCGHSLAGKYPTNLNTLHAEMMSRGDAPTRNYFHHVNTEMATLKLLRVFGVF